jgi:H+/Cl- antiporter ClcA
MSPHKESYFSVDHRRYLIVCGAGVALTAIMCFDPQRDPLFDHSQQYTFLKSILAFAYKFTVTAVAVTLPLPVGLFTPVFITGSILGRLLWKVVFTYAPGFSRCSPWEFALVGAASFTTGVTRGISTGIKI